MLFKRSGGISWLVVFLGNPGTKYEMTRHNAGFMAGDAMAKAQGAAINRSRFKALTGTCDIGGETVMLMKPQTFMSAWGLRKVNLRSRRPWCISRSPPRVTRFIRPITR